MNIAESVLSEARARGLKISCAESCTGGLVGAALTEVAGSSDVFNGSAVTYSNEAKHNILGVKSETLERFGAVSPQCAIEMAEGSRRIYCADFAVSITGIAGPDGGTDTKPVGTVCFGIAGAEGSYSVTKNFPGNRREVRTQSVQFALSELLKAITLKN